MAYCLFGAKPLPEPVLTYCQFDHWEETSMKFELKFVIHENAFENVVCEMVAILATKLTSRYTLYLSHIPMNLSRSLYRTTPHCNKHYLITSCIHANHRWVHITSSTSCSEYRDIVDTFVNHKFTFSRPMIALNVMRENTKSKVWFLVV